MEALLSLPVTWTSACQQMHMHLCPWVGLDFSLLKTVTYCRKATHPTNQTSVSAVEMQNENLLKSIKTKEAVHHWRCQSSSTAAGTVTLKSHKTWHLQNDAVALNSISTCLLATYEGTSNFTKLNEDKTEIRVGPVTIGENELWGLKSYHRLRAQVPHQQGDGNIIFLPYRNIDEGHL